MISYLPFCLFVLLEVGNIRLEANLQDLPPSISEYVYANVSGCLAFFSRRIQLHMGEKFETLIDLEPSQMVLSNDSFCAADESRFSLGWQNASLPLSPIMISMDFKLDASGYWHLNSGNITLKNTLYPLKLNWPSLPTKLGYKCQHTTSVLFSNSTRYGKLTFTGLQVQPFNADSGRFREASDCIGFFSTGVLSNLLVVFLLLGIFFYGLVMVIGIQSHDSFDDPKIKMIQLGITTE